MTRFLIALFFVFAGVPAAFAAPAITQSGADALKKQTQDILAYQAASLKASGMTLTQQGDVVVEPAGTYYAVTTPNLTVKMPGNLTRTIGMVAINAIPTDNPDAFKMAVALPTPILDTDAAGNTVGNISIGQQSMSGLYNFKYRNFTELTGSYKDIAIQMGNGFSATIPSVTTQTKLTDNGQGLVSGPSQTTITGLSYTDKNGAYSAQNTDIKIAVDDLDLMAVSLFRTELQKALLFTPKAGEEKPSLYMLAIDFLGKAARDLTLQYSSSGIVQKMIDAGKTTTISTASSNLSATFKGLKSNNASMTWDTASEGIKADNPEIANFVPSRMSGKMEGTNLPMAKYMALSPAAQKSDWVKLLTEAGSNVKIQNLVIDAASFGLGANVNMTGNKNAFNGISGEANLDVRGLDTLLKWMTDANGAQAQGMPAIPPQFLGIVGMVQMAGKPGTDAAGRVTHGYQFILAPDGSVMLNGNLIMPAKTTATAPKA